MAFLRVLPLRVLPLLAGAALLAGSALADDAPNATGKAASGFVLERMTVESTAARGEGELAGLRRSLERARDNGMTTTRPAAGGMTLEEAIRLAQWRQSVSTQLEAYWR